MVFYGKQEIINAYRKINWYFLFKLKQTDVQGVIKNKNTLFQPKFLS